VDARRHPLTEHVCYSRGMETPGENDHPIARTETIQSHALQAEIDRLRNLLQEIALVAAYEAPERAVERISELTEQA
jgi:hypothetical protein